MEIDLKSPASFTLDAVRQLIASEDDSADRQLRVNNDGIAFLSNETGAQNKQNILFRFETWDEGNDYTGIRASKDDEWVGRIFNALQNNWPNPSSKVIDIY